MAITVLLVISALTLLYFYATRRVKFWANTGVKCLTMPTLLGAIRGTFFNFADDLYTFAPEEPYVGITTLSGPAVSVRDPDMIEKVVIFPDRSVREIDEKNDPLSPNLFFIDGKRWKIIRRKIAAVFTIKKVREIFPATKSLVDQMTAIISSHAADSGRLDMNDVIARCTVDIITNFAFSLQGNSMTDPDAVYVKMLRKHFKMSPGIRIRRNLMNAVPVLFKLIPEGEERQDINKFFYQPFLVAAHDRLENDIKKPDFLGHLLDLKISGAGVLADGPNDRDPIEFTDSLMAAQAWGFFIAGTETSSSTTAFAVVELANNIDTQDRLRQEVIEVIKHHDGISYDALKDMVYMDQVVSETLRLHSPFKTLRRRTTGKYTLPGTQVTVPAGTRIYIHIKALHRDPKYFPEPEKFNPERFTPEAKRERHKFVYMPFGAGPRNCLGTRLGLFQVKLILATLISQFEFRPKPGIPYPPVISTQTNFTTLKHGASVLFTRIPQE